MTAVSQQEKSRPGAQGAPHAPDERPRGLAGTIAAWCQTTLGLGVISGLLMWLAFPPVGFAPAIWLSPIGLVLLIRQDALKGRHPYLSLYGAGFLSWLLLLHWLRLPHWVGYVFSWPGASAVVACYFPLFVGLSRVLVHRWKVSVVVAAPVVWTGLELLRAHFPHGFTMASLGHAPYRWLTLIQVSDLAGCYAVSFVIMLVAASVARMLPWDGRKGAVWPVLPLALALLGSLVYGRYRLHDVSQISTRPLKAAIIQGSFDTTFRPDPGRAARIYETLHQQTIAASKAHPDVELFLWPETMFGLLLQPGEPVSNYTLKLGEDINGSARGQAWFLLGAEIGQKLADGDEAQTDDYNAALLLSPDGHIQDRYDKMNPIWFGEYIPLGDYFPWFYKLSPLRGGLAAGTRPAAFDVNGVRFCPSICYESILPHHIRQSVTTLRSEGREPHVLVNLTNSGWFWGSSELDLHLICNVFRAVECRKPMLVAANTGISAWIDVTGELKGRGARREADTIIAPVSPSEIRSVYTRVGDWPAGLCLLVCLAAAGHGLILMPRRLRCPRCRIATA